MACVKDNPIDDNDRYAIWKWAKDVGGIDKGVPIEKVHDLINQQFYGGKAKPEWINDILSGRKTPFKSLANDLWKKQYNRRVIVQQANDLSNTAAMGTTGKVLRALWWAPRSVAVAGHGLVFPITHAGELMFRPASWATFAKGVLRTYRTGLPFADQGYIGRVLDTMKRDTFESIGWKGDQRSLYDLGLRSGVDMGAKSHPSGLISRYYAGPAARAWDALTVMRYELWKSQLAKFIKPGMSDADMLGIGKELGEWANHATGSGEGRIADLGGTLFGPKLTQSKISRLTSDPAKTIKTFSNWSNATPGEKAVAQVRLSGAAQYAATLTGFLAVNQGILQALGVNQKINWTNPTKGDWFAFKGMGLLGYVPGIHTELRTLGQILVASTQGTPFGQKLASLDPSLSYLSQNPKEGRLNTFYDIAKDYAKNKLTPSIARPVEAAMGENWKGQPLPWSSQEYGINRYGKPASYLPRESWGQYAGEIGPIPLDGPIGYFYDNLKESGASSGDAMSVIKGIIGSALTPQGAAVTAGSIAGLHLRKDTGH